MRSSHNTTRSPTSTAPRYSPKRGGAWAAPRLLIALLGAVIALALLPASGYAQAPDNDDYLNSTFIHDRGSPLPERFQDLGTNTDLATEQDELFGPGQGGGAERIRCDFSDGRQVHYGKTVWYDFFPHVDGQVLLRAGPFDAVIGLVPYNAADSSPFFNEWLCADDPALKSSETALFDVTAGRSYSIQIGGFAGEGDVAGVAASGDLEFLFNFFPDTDGDNIQDSQDRCPSQRGEARYAGCADSDGDGKPDPDDACPATRGDLANGCPSPPGRPDGDRDGVFDDGPDKCLGQNSRARDANDNGCLDLRTFSPTWIFRPGLYFARRGGRNVLLGVAVRRFGVSGVPRGARVVVTCTRRACKRMVKRARGGRVTFGKLQGRKLRAGTLVTIRVTRPGWVGRARVYRIERNDLSVTNRCLRPGSSRLQTRCSAVR